MAVDERVMATKKEQLDTTDLVLRELFCCTPHVIRLYRVGVLPDSVSQCPTRLQ
jgi:hypothetical protein